MHRVLSSTKASLISLGRVSVNSSSLIRNRAEMESGLIISHDSPDKQSGSLILCVDLESRGKITLQWTGIPESGSSNI